MSSQSGSIVLSLEELEAIREDAAASAPRGPTQAELDGVRADYQRRLAQVEADREELEWAVRLELANMREAETAARNAAIEMKCVASRIEQILTAGEARRAAAEPTQPAASHHRPPPIPAAASSHRETFQRAMANRKLSIVKV